MKYSCGPLGRGTTNGKCQDPSSRVNKEAVGEFDLDKTRTFVNIIDGGKLKYINIRDLIYGLGLSPLALITINSLYLMI